VTRLDLGPLAPAAAQEVVQAMTGDHPLPPQVVSELVDRAGGNPLFLEALVLEARRAGSSAQLPESVEGLVTSQIDRLDPADRTVVRYAAVFGTLVEEAALNLLLEEQNARVQAGALRRLADFLERDRHGGLRFRNALIRDVAYEGLPFRRRKALHDHVGQALEQAAAEPASQCELLSLHFFHAGRHERAWRYSVLAGERASAKYAHGEAIEFFARAAQSAARGAEVDRYEVARVYEQLADSRWLVGLTQEAADAYAAARAQLRGDPVRLAGIIEKEARIDQRRRKHSVALRRISTGLNRLSGVPGERAGVARSLLARRYAHSRFSQGRIDEALHWANVAADEAEEAADKDALAQAYEMLNFIYASSRRSEPLPYGRLALQAYVELGNLPRQGHCLNNLAMQEYTQGRWDESLSHLRRAADIFRRIGDTAAEANALFNQVELLVRQGRSEEAGAALPGVLRNARAVEDDELVGLALREQARTAGQVGDLTTAMGLLDEAQALFTALGEPEEARTTEITRAELLLDAGSGTAAGRVLASVSDAGEPPDATMSRLLGRSHLAEGRFAEARVVLEAGIEMAERDVNPYEEGLLLLVLSELTEREGGSDEATARRARQLLDSLGVRAPGDVQPTLPRMSLGNSR
jgi:tetratricopeptide (TPR) repeat protein